MEVNTNGWRGGEIERHTPLKAKTYLPTLQTNYTPKHTQRHKDTHTHTPNNKNRKFCWALQLSRRLKLLSPKCRVKNKKTENG